MKKILQHETVHEFWGELNKLPALPFQPTEPRAHHQQRLRVQNDHLSVRVTRRPYFGVTSLRVSVPGTRSVQREVTKLDFNKQTTGPDTWLTVGHLVIPPPLYLPATGLHIASLGSLPSGIELDPAFDVLDQGVKLLDQLARKKAMLELWVVGPRTVQ